MIELWSAYNRYLAHVLHQIPESASETACSIGRRPQVSLLWLAGDYVEHLKHHLNQILGNQFQTAWVLQQPSEGFEASKPGTRKASDL